MHYLISDHCNRIGYSSPDIENPYAARNKKSDWKLLKQLHPVALERFSQRILSGIGSINADSAKSSHQFAEKPEAGQFFNVRGKYTFVMDHEAEKARVH